MCNQFHIDKFDFRRDTAKYLLLLPWKFLPLINMAVEGEGSGERRQRGSEGKEKSLCGEGRVGSEGECEEEDREGGVWREA